MARMSRQLRAKRGSQTTKQEQLSKGIDSLRFERSKKELEQAKQLLEKDIIRRQKAEKQLRESKQQLESLSSQLLSSQEEERQRIAQELHDSVGQTLTALKYITSFQTSSKFHPSKNTQQDKYHKKA